MYSYSNLRMTSVNEARYEAYIKHQEYLHGRHLYNLEGKYVFFVDSCFVFLLDDTNDLSDWVYCFERVNPDFKFIQEYAEEFRSLVYEDSIELTPKDPQAFSERLKKFKNKQEGAKVLVFAWYQGDHTYLRISRQTQKSETKTYHHSYRILRTGGIATQ